MFLKPATAADPIPTGPSMEVELKLVTDPAGLAAIGTYLKTHAGKAATGPVRRQTSVYYDTADRRLQRRGLSLRVREENNSWMQTLKGEPVDAAGALSQPEWSTPLNGPEPDLNSIENSGLRDRMGLILPQELSPLFTTETQRTLSTLVVSIGRGLSGTVEVALDECIIAAGTGKTTTIAEVELELLSGSPALLFEFAAGLMNVAPLQISIASKAERGFDLIDPLEPEACSAPPVDLNLDMTAADALAAVAHATVTHLITNRAAAVDGRDIEGVHQVRVAARRLRSLRSIFKSIMPDDTRAWLKTEAKWLLDGMGPARDLDVFLSETLAAVEKSMADDADLAVLRKAAEQARKRAYTRVHRVLDSQRFTRMILYLGGHIEAPPEDTKDWPDADRPIGDLATALLNKNLKRVRKQGRGFEQLDAETRHQLRLDVKKLRYVSDFFSVLYPKSNTAPFVRTVKRLQDGLGIANDVAVASALMDKIATDYGKTPDHAAALHRAAGKVTGWQAGDAALREKSVIDTWRAFRAAAPFWPKKA